MIVDADVREQTDVARDDARLIRLSNTTGSSFYDKSNIDAVIETETSSRLQVALLFTSHS